MKLVIVESPSKAKTIEKYLGKDYTVRASVGHVRDLPKSNKKAIDVEGGFIPHYEISKGKDKVIEELTKLSKKADEIYLATDPDREGEAISWHLAQVLGLGKTKIKNKKLEANRVVFHEITEKAVKEAFNHPRSIDIKLIKAQEARRVLDRLVGYDLSGLIWKKVRYGLSAGRVQSPALRIIMEREREIRAFVPESYWVITANTETSKKESITFTYSIEPKSEEEANTVVAEAKSNPWQVESVEETSTVRHPKPPFITSTIQQVASTRLGSSPSNTMRLAQKLYEAGHITYMRTDSVNLSKDAVAVIANVIEKKWGKDYLEVREYKTKSKNAQEAHEAIRPTHPEKESVNVPDDQKKLYKLIWERTVASQMKDADIKKTKIKARVNNAELELFISNGSRVMDPGWLVADHRARGEDVELPIIKEGDKLNVLNVESESKETEPPNRFTEAGLVKEMEKRGIGRPSTYASITKTIVDRGYVNKDGKTLTPTDTGDVVSSFLEANFADVISDTFTAGMEEELDEIARGENEYEKVLRKFYIPFAKDVKAKDKEIGKITTLGDVDSVYKCPICSDKMVWKLGRSGKFMSCAKFPLCTGARTSEGEEMKGPQETGEKCPKCGDTPKQEGKLVERGGRFGTFIACSRYPKCKFVREDAVAKEKANTHVKCPICKKDGEGGNGEIGEMIERRGRFGLFYSCSNYPDCKYIIKSKPTGNICGYIRESGPCTKLMMEGTKTIPERCGDKQCPNHNPHKLKV